MRLVRLSRIAAAVAVLLPATAAAQTVGGTDGDFRWSGAIRSGQTLRVNNVSGDVVVSTHTGSQVEVVAIRRGASDDREARVQVVPHSDGITVCALRRSDDECTESGSRSRGGRYGRNDRDWREQAYHQLEVRVPRGVRVSAASVSGDVRITGTTARVSASTVSGDVRMENVAAESEVEGTTVSGDVAVALTNIPSSASLKFTSVSGDVTVRMPENSGVDLEMSTVSGDLDSDDFPLTLRGRVSGRRISAQIGRGGAGMRVSTVSGDLRLARN